MREAMSYDDLCRSTVGWMDWARDWWEMSFTSNQQKLTMGDFDRRETELGGEA